MMKRRVDNQMDGIKIPQMGVYAGKVVDKNGNTRSKQSIAVKRIVTTLYPQWFTSDYADKFFKTEDIDDYANEQLMFFLDDLLHEYLDQIGYQIVTWSFGIDCEKKSVKDMMKILNMKDSAIKMVKLRSMKKLKSSICFKNKLSFYVWTEEIKTMSDAIHYANNNLKLYKK